MSTIDQSGTFPLGGRHVKRLGYGAMELAGPGVSGPASPEIARAGVTPSPARWRSLM